MIAEAALLGFARAQIIMIVEPGFADCHRLGMPRECHQVGDREIEFLVGVMRMGPDRATDIGKAVRDGDEPISLLHASRDGDHAADAGRLGARHDAVEIAGEIVEIEMAMAVDQHRVRSLRFAIVRRRR